MLVWADRAVRLTLPDLGADLDLMSTRWIGSLLAVLVVASTSAVSPLAATPVAAAPAVSSPTNTCSITGPSLDVAGVVSASHSHAQVWRLYQAVFLRQPAETGLEHWAAIRANAKPLPEVAKNFTDGPEFQNRYGSLSDLEFVRLVYRNILCRPAAPSGEAYWRERLQRGSLTRPEMVVNFSELREFLRFTGTCHSMYPTETAAVEHCRADGVVPLAQATMAANGYRAYNRTIGRVGGGTGSFTAVEVDLTRAIASRVFETSSERCPVASINANWMTAATKDSPNPAAVGLGVVDGIPVRNSADRTDRGVFGLRIDPNPGHVIQTWPGNPVTADDTRLNSVMYSDGNVVLEQWQASAETSPYLLNLKPEQVVGSGEWTWAAAGIPLRIDGQDDQTFASAYWADTYTHQTLNHSFVAVDQDRKRLVFGATSTVDSRDLLTWFRNNGFEDLIKFDGGASTEMNIGGRAVVAGTSRDVPVWLGIGC